MSNSVSMPFSRSSDLSGADRPKLSMEFGSATTLFVCSDSSLETTEGELGGTASTTSSFFLRSDFLSFEDFFEGDELDSFFAFLAAFFSSIGWPNRRGE
jgi:hypothetical protein